MMISLPETQRNAQPYSRPQPLAKQVAWQGWSSWRSSCPSLSSDLVTHSPPRPILTPSSTCMTDFTSALLANQASPWMASRTTGGGKRSTSSRSPTIWASTVPFCTQSKPTSSSKKFSPSWVVALLPELPRRSHQLQLSPRVKMNFIFNF